MRSHFIAQLSLCCLLFSSVLRADDTAAAWEVLDGCQIVKASINDGDSFKVTHKDKTFIIRLYFVDCLETTETYMDRVRDQARYFSISESQVIASGKTAATYTQKFLQGEFTVITQWVDARGSKEARYFGLVMKNNQLLSSELVRNGLARIYGMPPQSQWPGGLTPRSYLAQLKQYERNAQRSQTGIWSLAQGSPQIAGLDYLATDHAGTTAASALASGSGANQTGQIILNTASAAELDTLPGIGPALANSIIAARPIAQIDDLTKIPGITQAKIDAFRALVLTEAPPPPANTAAFYLADPETYLDSVVTVTVSTVAQSDLAAPSSFRAVRLYTAYQGLSGGVITAFIPDEFYDSFIQYYQEPNRSFTGLLFKHDADIVLVYSRK